MGKKIPFSCKLDEDLIKFAKDYAKRHYRSVTSLFNEMLDNLRKKEKEGKENKEER